MNIHEVLSGVLVYIWLKNDRFITLHDWGRGTFCIRSGTLRDFGKASDRMRLLILATVLIGFVLGMTYVD